MTGSAVRGHAGRFVCVLALVLPVPLCAALGLSLPLPATVERIAAKVVPFGDSNRLAAGAVGSIELAPGEARTNRVATPGVSQSPLQDGRVKVRDRRTSVAASPAVIGPGPRTGDANDLSAGTTTTPTAETQRPVAVAPGPSQEAADDPASPPLNGGGGSEEPPTGGASEPVKPATDTAKGAVETVNTAVSDTTKTVEETTQDAVDSATGALGITPP